MKTQNNTPIMDDDDAHRADTERFQKQTTITALQHLGFDVENWDMPGVANVCYLQITDKTGITFYMSGNSTLEQCLVRYQKKCKEFDLA